jgi:hypothetical protein
LDSLTIIRPVSIKIRVTETFKNELKIEIQEAIKKLDLEIQQIEFQAKRFITEMEKKTPQKTPAVREHFDEEKQKRIESKNKLLERLKQIPFLTIGEEVFQGSINTIAEIKQGDDWNEVMDREIIIEDGKIIELR